MENKIDGLSRAPDSGSYWDVAPNGFVGSGAPFPPYAFADRTRLDRAADGVLARDKAEKALTPEDWQEVMDRFQARNARPLGELGLQ
ncbi:MAG TPA: hypothetical protein VFB59_04915 [Candidatus Saccharimonadales bacterium]|nr:hypothetical protein [Candidatus Saccharimonadales bacterium]